MEFQLDKWNILNVNLPLKIIAAEAPMTPKKGP